jgi:hypothetical protein
VICCRLCSQQDLLHLLLALHTLIQRYTLVNGGPKITEYSQIKISHYPSEEQWIKGKMAYEAE